MAILGSIAAGTLAAFKFGGRAAMRMGSHSMNFTRGAGRGAASVATNNTGWLGVRLNTPGIGRLGEHVGADAYRVGRGATQFVGDELRYGAVGGTYRMGGRLARRMFVETPASATWYNPAGIQLTRGSKWAVGLGALGVGGALGYRDFARGERIGLPEYNRMQELSYGGRDMPSPLESDDLGATGDLVLALNNLKK